MDNFKDTYIDMQEIHDSVPYIYPNKKKREKAWQSENESVIIEGLGEYRIKRISAKIRKFLCPSDRVVTWQS